MEESGALSRGCGGADREEGSVPEEVGEDDYFLWGYRSLLIKE